ncbi:MAG: hypothetical protein PHQ36_04540 [Anaerolineales bacterium]|nr:hypothetical protein [Anaerolineales bacterium]
MTNIQMEFWSAMSSVISALMVVVAAFSGAIKYIQEQRRNREIRQEELAWRKTQFILELADDFEKDAQYRIARRLLSYNVGVPKNSALGKVLGDDTSGLNKSEMELRYAIDDYLDFFDRLYHFTFITRSLSVSDIEIFGWYIVQIGQTKELCDYAHAAGFEDVLKLNSEIGKLFERKHWYQTVREHPLPYKNDKAGRTSLQRKGKKQASD